MKFKYKIKIYKKNSKKSLKVIFGDLILNNKIYNIYLLKNNFFNFFFKNNFITVIYFKKKYFTYFKSISFSKIKNKIDYFILEIIKKKIKLIIYINNIKNKKIYFINNNNFLPRKINLIFINFKKINYKNFNFYFYKKKIDFFEKK
ncbi:MAG: hypothetical protein ACH6QQ_00820 [Candidatus Carsonella ruddii]